MSHARFASFWHGAELSPYEVASLSSFAAYGNEVTLYSYHAPGNLPAGVQAKDANQILPPDALDDFPIDGVPSVAHFSDYFRYAMFTKTDQIWIDTDMLLLRPFELDAPGDVIGKSSATSLCSSLLRLDPHDPRLNELLKRVRERKGIDARWGDTGERLLTDVYGVQSGMAASLFDPIPAAEYYKVLLPRYLDECDALCSGSYALHLSGKRLDRMGLYRRIGPPVGSFLERLFARTGVNAMFREHYPAEVMQTMIDNAAHVLARDDAPRKRFPVGVPLFGSAFRSPGGRGTTG